LYGEFFLLNSRIFVTVATGVLSGINFGDTVKSRPHWQQNVAERQIIASVDEPLDCQISKKPVLRKNNNIHAV